MRVSAPLDSSTRAVLADWVELQVLLSDGPIAEQQLLRSQAVQSDPEHGDVLSNLDLEPVDEEILEPAADELSQRVNEELTYRQSTLGSLYPFEITFEYGSWILRRSRPRNLCLLPPHRSNALRAAASSVAAHSLHP